MNFEYKINTATRDEIIFHLNDCRNNFLPPLDQRISIPDYAEKIFTASVTFEAWRADLLIGLAAAYFNNDKTREGFITNVSVIKSHMGRKISSQLMDMCINYGKEINFKKITLEVNINNTAAIQLYKKSGFRISGIENENQKMTLEL